MSQPLSLAELARTCGIEREFELMSKALDGDPAFVTEMSRRLERVVQTNPARHVH